MGIFSPAIFATILLATTNTDIVDSAAIPLTLDLQLMLGFWLVVLGGCIGSFMNVVIYRIPAGMSVVHPGSHCPKCGHAIRWYDNIPVISWLILRARCRDCRTPISSRYPLVEGTIALLFLLVGWREILSVALITEIGNAAPTLTLAAHLLLLCTLFCLTMIAYDSHTTPTKKRLRVSLAATLWVVSLIWILWQG